MRRSGVDVLGLNELNGWSASTFGQLARAWGLPYHVLLEGATGYHLGLASRWPLALEEANFMFNGHVRLLMYTQRVGHSIALCKYDVVKTLLHTGARGCKRHQP